MHGGGLGVAPAPAEPGGALVVALHQRAAGEGLAVDRVGHGVVDPAQFDRIDAQGVAEFVHAAFQAEHVGRLGRGPHEARRVSVGVDHLDLGHDVRAGIDARGALDPGDIVAGRPRGEFLTLVDEGREPAVPAGGELNMLAGLGAVGGDCEALIAGADQLHRAMQAARGDGDPCGAGGVRALGAEGAADEARHHADIGLVDAQLLGHGRLGSPHELAGLIDGELRPVPDAGGGEQLHGVVVLGRRRIAGVDLDRRRGEGGRRVALGRVLGAGLLRLARLHRDPWTVEGGAGGLLVIVYLDPVGGFPRGLEGLGHHHRDDLAVVPDLVCLKRGGHALLGAAEGRRCLGLAADIGVVEDVEHPRHGLGAAQAHGADASPGDAADHQIGVGRMRHRLVGGVAGLAGDLGHAVHAGRGLAEQVGSVISHGSGLQHLGGHQGAHDGAAAEFGLVVVAAVGHRACQGRAGRLLGRLRRQRLADEDRLGFPGAPGPVGHAAEADAGGPHHVAVHVQRHGGRSDGELV